MINLTEKTNNVNEAKPPKAASANVGRIAEGKTLGKKYPPMVDKAAAFDKSSQYLDNNLYWEETNFSFISSYNSTKEIAGVKRKNKRKNNFRSSAG